MEKIASFTINHLTLEPGVYVSRVDTDPAGGTVATTFDLRWTAPNREPVMDTAAIHAVEHLAATFLRNNEEWKDRVLYFGPMGCRTGFYLILFGEYEPRHIIGLLRDMCAFIASFEGEIPGARPEECGNWHDSDLPMARYHAKRWLEQTLNVIDDAHMTYPTF